MEIIEIMEIVLLCNGRCYGMALKLRPDMASLWHDLGVNYFHQSCMADKIMSKVAAGKSLDALKKAVTLCPSSHSHWSALGVVAASKGLVHYLIQV